MAKSLHLSQDLKLPVDVAGEAIGILATRGAGKSYTSAALIEELHDAGIQFCVLDPAGVFWGLRASADGKGDGLPVFLLGGAHGDVPLEPTAGALIADLLVDTGQSLILDLSDFPSKGSKTRFVADFAERLYLRKSRHRTTLHLVIDEAHEFAPQKPQRDEARMLGAIEHLIRGGRSRGLGATLITQRSAALNKTVLDLIETLIAMRVLSPRDRKVVSDWITAKDLDDFAGEQLVSDLPSMKTGTAWVWSPVRGILSLARMRRIRTFDSYATPKPGEKRTEPRKLADIDIGALGEQIKATAERAKANDPRFLQAEVARLAQELAMRPVAEPEKAKPASKGELRAILKELLNDLERSHLDKMVHACTSALEVVEAAADGAARDIRSAFRDASIAFSHEHDRILDEAQRRSAQPKSPPGRPDFVAGYPSGRAYKGTPTPRIAPPSSDSALSGPEQRILNAIAWFEAIGVPEPEGTAVAFMAGYSPGGGAYQNPRGKLRGAGLIEYRGACLALTVAGREKAQAPIIVPTREGLHAEVLARLPGPEQRLLRPLLAAYPNGMTNEDLAAAANYAPTGGAFQNPRGRLRTLGLVEYRDGMVFARGILFP